MSNLVQNVKQHLFVKNNKLQQPTIKHREAVAHMKAAFVYAELSHCKRKQVGCIIVKNNRIISIGCNGTPSGWENVCEDCFRRTKPEVYHAETNAVAKLASSNESGYGASVFLTCSPCYDCAKLLSQMKVKEVYYAENYQASTEATKGTGLDHLEKCGIPTYHFPVKQE